ncbi:HAMP domain-containing sensor histidine kinase [Spirulina sp. CS-785/01]|uniref:sensor histidine kinase n=1 Tax=Spirulina sp. CS-785/01 TaxID=3021716 RepID=UPI00232F5ADA|nr:HAMP domain-containing sensor histidine kinase [Spirulina sp. CS-785/01]MDB9313558.1 HAMP domain-containing sensor histidine kinase [Spirulina sp. CS-785/01]
MPNWSLPTLSQILERDAAFCWDETPEERSTFAALLKAEREWSGAIAALEKLLLQFYKTQEQMTGVMLSSPSPVVSDRTLLTHLHTGIFTPKSIPEIARGPGEDKKRQRQLPAASQDGASAKTVSVEEYPLLANDPLNQEQFCLVLTPEFGLLLVLGKDSQGQAKFYYSFDPETVQLAWVNLRSRLLVVSPHHLPQLDPLIQQFTPPTPDYRLVTAFSQQLLNHLPDLTTPTIHRDPIPTFTALTPNPSPSDSGEMELLQALTHEIRTPLTTIRMLTRLMLKKRANLSDKEIERLEAIDQECTQQIDRMELIFRAAELETQPQTSNPVQLVPISLQQVIQQNVPHWQKQAKRRQVNLDVGIPEQLPTVVSHPDLLSRVLSGVMDSLTRTVPTGGQLQVRVSTAGNQLKLQLKSSDTSFTHSLQAMGQLLMFQPETGSLSLNLDVTKNLFQVLGGKLTVRQHPQKGEVLTIFLPLGNHHSIFAVS